MITKDLVVIGGGSAGMAAAIGAYEEGIKDILVLEKEPFLGGILNQCIHNGFGLGEFKEELSGPEFASRFIEKVKERGIEFKLNAFVTSITKDKVVTYSTREGSFQIQAKSIIMATGCYERTAGAIGLPGDRPAGVLSAGQAQLFLNEYGYLVGKRVFILGSGDIGLIMARRLTLEGAEVLGVAELCAWSNGLNRNIVQCLEDYNIPLFLSHTVTKIVGRKRLEKIVISKVDDKNIPIPGTEKEFECDTLILSVGLIPNNWLLNTINVPQSATKGSLVNEKLETAIPGVFSCGNVLHVHDLVDNVVVEAREAGKNAATFVKGITNDPGFYNDVLAGDGISYVIPGKVDLSKTEEDIFFKFRVRKPSNNVYIIFEQAGQIIKKIFKPVIIPSEMEIIKLNKSLFKKDFGTITVRMMAKEN